MRSNAILCQTLAKSSRFCYSAFQIVLLRLGVGRLYTVYANVVCGKSPRRSGYGDISYFINR